MNKLFAILCAAALGALGAFPAPARADVSAAARAFSDGQAAQLEGNHERAAQSFELAFNISPTKEALRSAIRARLANNQLPRAATLAAVLLARYGDDPPSAKLAGDVLGEAKIKLARIAVTCDPACTLAVGGRAVSLNAAASHIAFAPPGRTQLEIAFDRDRTVTREVTLKAGDELALPIAPPVERRPAATGPAPAPRDPGGLRPAIAITGGILTIGLAGVTAWSALDTQDAHKAYVAAPSHEGWTDGRSKQLRTNILLGSTVAAAAWTVLVAAFWTRWHEPAHAPALTIAPTDGGAAVSFGGRF